MKWKTTAGLGIAGLGLVPTTTAVRLVSFLESMQFMSTNLTHAPLTLLAAINMTTNSRRRDEENDSLEVVVDGDEAPAYGGPQYTESDIHAAQGQDGSNSAQHDVKV